MAPLIVQIWARSGFEDIEVNLNRYGERRFDYLTSALVLSKPHREGCKASYGGFPYCNALMEEIEALVNRHKDRLHVGVLCLFLAFLICSFGQHTLELITSELGLRILSILSEEQFLPKVDPLLLNKTFEKIVIKIGEIAEMEMLKYTAVMYHYPCPDGAFVALAAHIYFFAASLPVCFFPNTVYSPIK
ncbi:hypothetical protein Tco_0120939 [Tanacetum coccineum]